MKKQTAVEWLMQQLKNIDITHKEVFEQAKAMEKEQIMDAAMWMPKSFNTEFIPELAEQYYNETFKSE